MIIAPIHPDDLLFFNEVSSAMRRVAREYELPLQGISHLMMPASGMADRMGECSHSGNIRLVLRCTLDGAWCDAPLSPDEVWDTAAHELAHLRHFNHGIAFHEFQMEMQTALRNRRVDHRDRILAKLVKMQAQRDGEAAIGNSAAAEAFAGAINRMLIEHELNPTDIDYARTADRDPVIEVCTDLSKYRVDVVKTRVAWQEELARIVAQAHLCSFLIRRHSNGITFVGTKAHATVAEYTFGTMVRAAAEMSLEARGRYRNDLRRQHGIASGRSLKGVDDAFGFRESWLAAFTTRLSERFAEARRAAVEAAMGDVAVAQTGTALLRLNGALARTTEYINDKFAGRKIRYAKTLSALSVNNQAGRERGRDAANAMAIGRRAMTGTAAAKQLR